MSGPEWTNDEPGPDHGDDSRPLSPPAEPEHAHASEPESPPEPASKSVKIKLRAQAQPPEPAMAHAHASSDRDESGSAEPARSRRKLPAVLVPVLSWLAKIRLPSLGSERHEMMPDVPHDHPAEARAAEPAGHPSTKRGRPRFPMLGLKRETRVGIAALLSFVFLVTALLFNKGWLGSKDHTKTNEPPKLALGPPANDETPPAPEKEKEKKPAEKEEAKKEPKKDDSEPKEKGAESTPRIEEQKPPEAAPSDTGGTKITLVGDPKPGETEGPPKVEGEAVKPTLLPSMADPTSPPSAPGDVPTASSSAGSDPPKPTDVPKPADVPKPTPVAEAGPASPAGLPPIGDPPASPSPVAVAQEPPPSAVQPPPTVAAQQPAPQPVAEQPAPPAVIQQPAPIVDPAPAPSPTAAPPSPPVRSEKMPALESAPAVASGPPPTPASEAVEPAAAAVSTASALGAGWVVIQSGGRRIVGAGPIVSTPSSVGSPSPIRVADNPRGGDDPAVADQVEPVLHRVQTGENFWTISKLYYRSGRFYRALHAANERQVPNIRELYVGTVLRIPPPEALDRSLIDPPSRSSKTDDPATSPVSRTSKRVDPAAEADLAMPVRPRLSRPEPEPTKEPRRPTYTVKPYETLRSIARDTLNDPKRDKEIFSLNRDILDDPNDLPAGTTLTLPEDATIGRRGR